MRNRSITIFLAGLAAGAVGMYLVLWAGGVLTPYLETVNAAEQNRKTATKASETSNEAPRADTKSSGGGRILMPIEGLKPADLIDTFTQARSEGRRHDAIDIMSPRGTPVRAMVDGTIEKLFTSKAGGLTIYEFDRSGTYCYYYAHLDRYAEGMREDLEVARGTVIGYVGSTGNASPDAPHLHLAVNLLGPDKHWWQGEPVNPYPILLRAEP